jgi:hypothetical protein
MTNREKWVWAAYNFEFGRQMGKVILAADTTIWRRISAWYAMHCLMFYVAAFPEGPPDVAK